MKLIGNYTSPFVRKITIMLMEKGILFEFVNENPWLESSQMADYNPLGKVPALAVSENEVWYDSPIIASWLELQDKPPFFVPKAPMAALRIRQLEALADGLCEAALMIVREQLRAPEKQCESLLTRQRKKIHQGLDELEQAAAKGEELNGEQINLADIACGCMLGYLNFRHISPDWCVNRPALVKLAEKLFQRDSFARTRPPAP
ncbi:glutathione S-transferase [Erwinia sp. OLTSP20]|uniref:glutathione S-transferase n=1 Tax=unclassified Erwinia TaxID=2622719 RepID=UPI000C17DC83|nr:MULTISPECIES: glutathione S-transferase [unclassified Erwinia]PIJ49599.1 glutathione S-transferase [Erwinia sp. OAMSP11]PIJ71595.1 glutathione S-transferase [Erwinia sp. OLSSP12]PIJ82665.1 glutathione S-transferase [Erwinia sp. OLCASP19]PIJ83132.1 glutathione S-transferase [Erwinia sp. OLMTSP26]PIJ85298.1 glutathione S-transferase [Erwinia sp. OLMDSP33]